MHDQCHQKFDSDSAGCSQISFFPTCSVSRKRPALLDVFYILVPLRSWQQFTGCNALINGIAVFYCVVSFRCNYSHNFGSSVAWCFKKLSL
jgi:hypothetical protein